MHFASLFTIFCIFLWPTYGESANVLMDARKSQVFLQVFLKNALETKRLSIQKENIPDIIKTFQNAITTAQSKATTSAFASVIDYVFKSDGRSIGDKQKVIQSLLEKTYVQIGEEVERILIQEISNQIGYNTDAGVAVNTDVGIDIGLGIQDQTKVGLGLDTNVGYEVDFGVGVGIDFSTSSNVHLIDGEPGFGLDEDVLVKIAKKLGCILKASELFDLAVLSRDPLSVIHSTIPAVRVSLGVKAAEALSKCGFGG